MVTVTLPSGTMAVLRPLTGPDELLWLDLPESMSTAERSTTVLVRALLRLGSAEPVSPEKVSALTVGDREALLLHLRRLMMGDRLQCVATCTVCREPMDLELSVSQLLLPPYHQSGPLHEAEVTVAGVGYRAILRLPTGADQAMAAQMAAADLEHAARFLLGCSLHRLTRLDDDRVLPESEWPAGLDAAVGAALADLDPQAEVILSAPCPACGAALSLPFDTAGFFGTELARRARQIYRDVHTLALHYHWSEEAILAMPRAKRQIYLDLLAEQYGGGEGAP